MIQFTATIATMLVAQACKKLNERGAINKLTAVLHKSAVEKGSSQLRAWLRILLHIFVFWFFINQLVGLITSSAPLTRVDTFLIAFWTCWLIVYFCQVAFHRPS